MLGAIDINREVWSWLHTRRQPSAPEVSNMDARLAMRNVKDESESNKLQMIPTRVAIGLLVMGTNEYNSKKGKQDDGGQVKFGDTLRYPYGNW